MKKKFDSVAFQRKERAKASRDYLKDPEKFVMELKRKYGHLRTASARVSDAA